MGTGQSGLPAWGDMRIEAKDLTVITPCMYENEEPIWMFLASCRRFGITPTFYGKGEQHADWVDIMLKRLMEAARTCPTSHMLYTDSRDAFFLCGLDEIARKYNAMGAPDLLMGADCVGFSTYQEWYDKVAWDMMKAFPYFQVGGMVCNAWALHEAIGWMFDRRESGAWGHMPGDNPPWWCNFMAERPGELVLDHECEIFQNSAQRVLLNVSEGLQKRLYNSVTTSWPCVLHFNGGYTDQVQGKWESMESFWRALGYTENPPWEAK